MFLYCHGILSPLNRRAKTELSLRGPWVGLPRVCGAKNGPSDYHGSSEHTNYLHTPICPYFSTSPPSLRYYIYYSSRSRWRVRDSRRICISRHHGARPKWTLPGPVLGGDAISRCRGIYRWPLLQAGDSRQRHLFLLFAMSSR